MSGKGYNSLVSHLTALLATSALNVMSHFPTPNPNSNPNPYSSAGGYACREEGNPHSPQCQVFSRHPEYRVHPPLAMPCHASPGHCAGAAIVRNEIINIPDWSSYPHRNRSSNPNPNITATLNSYDGLPPSRPLSSSDNLLETF